MNWNKDDQGQDGNNSDPNNRDERDNNSVNDSNNGSGESVRFVDSNAVSSIKLSPLGEISGLGGWLVLVQIGIFATLLLNIVSLFNNILPVYQTDIWHELTSPSSEYYDANWMPALLFETVSCIALIAYTVFIVFAFYRKKRYIPKLMIIMYIGALVIAVVDHLLLKSIANVEEYANDNLSDIVRSFLTTVIWSWYFIKSKRVRNTFIQ